jgi:hypothetical protein
MFPAVYAINDTGVVGMAVTDSEDTVEGFCASPIDAAAHVSKVLRDATRIAH